MNPFPAHLVTAWARVQIGIGREFRSPRQMLEAYCDEVDTALSVDTPSEMQAAMRALRSQMMSDT